MRLMDIGAWRHTPFIFLALSVAGFAACGGDHSRSGEGYRIDPQASHWVEQAGAALDVGDYAGALRHVGRAEQIDSAAPTVSFTKGSILFEMGRFDESEAVLSALLADYPDFDQGWMKLGNVAMRQQDFDKAVAHYRNEVALRPTAQAWHNLGTAYVGAGDHEAARQAYAESRDADPAYAPAYIGLADVSEREGDYRTALEYARQAGNQPSADSRAKEKLGFLLLRSGQSVEAERVLRDVLENEPWNYQARYNLGQALQQQGLAEEGEEELRRSEADRAGQAQLRKVQRLVKRDPTNARLQFALGVELQKRGQLEEALRAYRIARQLAPDDLRIDLNMATIHLHRSEFDVAGQEFESIIQRDSSIAMAWLNLGFVRARQGEMGAAQAAWGRALAIEPGFQPAVDHFRNQLASR